MAHSHLVYPDGYSARQQATDYTGTSGSVYSLQGRSSGGSNYLKAQTTGTGVNNMNPYSALNQIIKT